MKDPDCIFCRIIMKQIPSKVEYEDKGVIAFRDINPQAPVHIIIVPRQHIPRLYDLDEKNVSVFSKMLLAANKIAKSLKITQDGYRIVSNCNAKAGQSVFHIHLHLLGGRIMAWPPG